MNGPGLNDPVFKARSGSGCMRNYRVFKLDLGGCVVDARWIESEDDAGAVSLAIDFGQGTRCEIWDQDRLVGMSEPFGAGTQTFCPRWSTSRSPYAEERSRSDRLTGGMGQNLPLRLWQLWVESCHSASGAVYRTSRQLDVGQLTYRRHPASSWRHAPN